MERQTSYEYKPGVRDKVTKLESRLAAGSTEEQTVTGEKRRVFKRNSTEKKQTGDQQPKNSSANSNDSNSKLNQSVILNVTTITSGGGRRAFTPSPEPGAGIAGRKASRSPPAPDARLQQLNKQSAKVTEQKNEDFVKTVTKTTPNATVPVPAPRNRQTTVVNTTAIAKMEENSKNPVSNSPAHSDRSGSSTRRSSEDDGIADMASESDPFDDGSMPLPKIKENPFLLKERCQQQTVDASAGASATAATSNSVPSFNLNFRRGSLNPQMGVGGDHKLFRTRTDSTNSAENFVYRQISADNENSTNRRESQVEIKIEVMQSKGTSQETESGLRSPVQVVRSKTMSNSTASILVLGLPRSGKSQTIESLVQKPVACHSSQPEIIEYTAKIKILDSSSLFSLKIIETPGYTNDPELLSDAQLMSTLVNYLESPSGLRGKTPTICLVTFRFDDQRLWNPEDEHPDIVNFLKLIHNFQHQLNDNKFANFVFVLTHFLSENTSDLERKRPQTKIVELTNLIQKYTSLPPPLIVVCAENQKNRSTVILPNGETYPYNLIDKIKALLTKKGRDSVGETVLRTAFGIEYPYSIKECQVTQKIPFLPATHLSVQQMKKTILHAYRDIQKTEIFTLLEIGWENIEPRIRKKYPESLFTVQQIFQTKKVANFTDIPEDPQKILSLVRQMPSNLAVKDLLIDTLQLKVPACYSALYVGQGFDLSKDSTTNVSPFQFSSGFKTSPVGLIPNEFQCKIRDDREICFKFFSKVEDYVSERLKDLNLRYSISPNSLSGLSAAASTAAASGQRWGYNLIRKNQEPTKSTIATAIIEHRIFQITLPNNDQQPELQFKPQFWQAIQDIPDLDIKDNMSVTAWRDFFGYWGTHVVKSGFGGGSIEITFRGSVLTKIYNSMKKDFILPSDEYDTTRVFQWVTGDGLDFVASCGKDVKNDFVQGHDVIAHFHGGDIKYQQVDLTKLESKEEVTNMREDWKESLTVNPVMLETNLVLVPLSYFVRSRSEGLATKIDVALHYFYSDFMVNQGKTSACSIL